jgi:hypothetical protein
MLDTDSLINVVLESDDLRETIPQLMLTNRYYSDIINSPDFIKALAIRLHLPKSLTTIENLITYSESTVDEKLFLAVDDRDLGLVKTIVEEDDAEFIGFALARAVEKGSIPIVKYLLGVITISDSDLINACVEASGIGSLAIIKIIIPYVQPKFYKYCMGRKIGSEKILYFFHDLLVSEEDRHSIYVKAAYNGYLGIIESADIDSKTATYILESIISDIRPDVLYFLLRRGATIPKNYGVLYNIKSYGVFKYVTGKETAVNLDVFSSIKNKKVFDSVYRILMRGDDEKLSKLLMVTMNDNNTKNFKKVFYSIAQNKDLLNRRVLERYNTLATVNDEIFEIIFKTVNLTTEHLMSTTNFVSDERIGRFTRILAALRKNGNFISEDVQEGYRKILRNAVINGNYKVVNQVIGSVYGGGKIDSIFSNSTTLHMAKLIERKKSVSKRALHLIFLTALSKGRINIAKHYYQYNNDKEIIDRTAHKISMNRPAAKFLLEYASANPEIVLDSAARNRSVRSLELALKYGAKSMPSSEGLDLEEEENALTKYLLALKINS